MDAKKTRSEQESGAPDVGLVLNPQSGTADRLGELLLSAAGLSLELIVPRSAEDFDDRVHDAALRLRRLIVAGGDGTLNRAIQALPRDADTELGILPFGTGNDFSRSLGLNDLPLGQLFEQSLSDEARVVDTAAFLSKDQTFSFVNVANGGLGGRIATLVHDGVKESVGAAAYWLASAQALADLVPHRVSLNIDSKALDCRLIGLAIANGRFAGGGFEVAPYASMDDGLLDLTLIPDLSALELLASGTRYVFDGQPAETPARALRGRRIEFASEPPMPFSIDGESFELSEGVFECRAGSLRVAAPSP